MRKTVWYRGQDLTGLKALSHHDYVSIGVGTMSSVDVVLDGCFTIAELRLIIDAMTRLENEDSECQPKEQTR